MLLFHLPPTNLTNLLLNYNERKIVSDSLQFVENIPESFDLTRQLKSIDSLKNIHLNSYENYFYLIKNYGSYGHANRAITIVNFNDHNVGYIKWDYAKTNLIVQKSLAEEEINEFMTYLNNIQRKNILFNKIPQNHLVNSYLYHPKQAYLIMVFME